MSVATWPRSNHRKRLRLSLAVGKHKVETPVLLSDLISDFGG